MTSKDIGLDSITLTCPSCGGKLQVTNDIDRFACTHCGTGRSSVEMAESSLFLLY
ncbi:MAG: hypothetical protein AB8I69_23480 [Anaerolineae bacterium]